MSLINKLVLGIYNNQLKDVDNKQQNMTWDSEVAIEENIPYKEVNDNLCTYDYIYAKREVNPNALPLIINIHGGAFCGGDKSINKYYGAFLARYHFQVATLNYHYAPEGNLKKQVQDCMAGITKVVENYQKEEFFLTGDSSGSVLVLLISLLWNNEEMRNTYEVEVPNAKIKALGLTGTQAGIDMFPSFMKPFNKENRRLILTGCEEVEKYTNIKELWNNEMPAVFIMSAEEDVCYPNCKDFDQFLTEKNHPHQSFYCKKKEEGKLYHCFNVIRPDLNCSKRMNEAMINYFNNIR